MEERVTIEDNYNNNESPTNAFLHRNRCCFQLPCFGSYNSNTTRHITLGGPTTSPTPATSSFWDRLRSAEAENRWWARPVWAFKKVREWSEIVAGPKWKTFIRRINRRRNNNPYRQQAGKFQYDPLSYALNFDGGAGQNGDFEEEPQTQQQQQQQFPDFSSRLAAVPLNRTHNQGEWGNGAPAC